MIFHHINLPHQGAVESCFQPRWSKRDYIYLPAEKQQNTHTLMHKTHKIETTKQQFSSCWASGNNGNPLRAGSRGGPRSAPAPLPGDSLHAEASDGASGLPALRRRSCTCREGRAVGFTVQPAGEERAAEGPPPGLGCVLIRAACEETQGWRKIPPMEETEQASAHPGLEQCLLSAARLDTS